MQLGVVSGDNCIHTLVFILILLLLLIIIIVITISLQGEGKELWETFPEEWLKKKGFFSVFSVKGRLFSQKASIILLFNPPAPEPKPYFCRVNISAKPTF